MRAAIRQFDAAMDLLDQNRLVNLLKKEDFREFLISKKAKRIVLDNSEYTSLPNAEGCFQRNGLWIVYATDDRSSVVTEAEYPTADAAFCQLAANINLEYAPNETIESLLPLSSGQDVKALEALVSRALIRLKTIANGLVGAKARITIIDDIVFLQEEQRRLREFWYTTTFDTIAIQLSDLEKQNESLALSLRSFRKQQEAYYRIMQLSSSKRGYGRTQHKKFSRPERTAQTLQKKKQYG